MGLLPAERTSPSPPFSVVGMDFAGPFQLKRGHTRKPVVVKAYVCLFICMATKAVHLELCDSLSTQDFMTVLWDFCNRRGLPQNIYSDNGSNFLGAKRELEQLQKLLKNPKTEQQISELATTKKFQ